MTGSWLLGDGTFAWTHLLEFFSVGAVNLVRNLFEMHIMALTGFHILADTVVHRLLSGGTQGPKCIFETAFVTWF